jgi:tRNA synthetase class II core domain (G, H, P, S and T)
MITRHGGVSQLCTYLVCVNSQAMNSASQDANFTADGLEFLHNKGYKPNQPPYMMLREQMAKTAQLEQFDEELYKVTDDPKEPKSDKYLIATSEQPLSVLHADEWIHAKDLPIKYAGTSTNFRKEAGKHGKDAWGIFRIHQFEKVQTLVIQSVMPKIFKKKNFFWWHLHSDADSESTRSSNLSSQRPRNHGKPSMR